MNNDGADSDAAEIDTSIVGRSTDGVGVEGISDTGRGIVGRSSKGIGVAGFSATAQGVWGETDGPGSAVHGKSKSGVGVKGLSATAQGVWGETDGPGSAVHGKSKSGVGVKGLSATAQGVWGEARASGRSGVVGVGDNGPGVTGESKADHPGVVGRSEKGQGIRGESKAAERAAVLGISQKGAGVKGDSRSDRHAGVHGIGPKLAGLFEGNVEVTGDIILRGADLAEQFTVIGHGPAEPGTVMVLVGDDAVQVSDAPYDRRVAGVVSGAGGYRPALVLDRQRGEERHALALTGKVYCKVDATYSPVTVGDLLTTSPTPGHAMRAADPHRSFGAVIGKALAPLDNRCGLIPILVALH